MPKEVLDDLIPVLRYSASVDSPGRHLIFAKDHQNICMGYGPEDVRFLHAEPPKLDAATQAVWERRRVAQFPDGIKRDGEMLGMLASRGTEGQLVLPVFRTTFSAWKLGLPWGDEEDMNITPGCIRPPIGIHTVAITKDQYMLFVRRGAGRASWKNSVLGFHSWGLDVDKDGFIQSLLPNLMQHQGEFLFEQARAGVLREFNPLGVELLKADDVVVNNITCLTLHLRPMDFGWHICFLAHIDAFAEDLINKRNKYPMPESGRIEEYDGMQFSEVSMQYFFETFAREGSQNPYRTATTTEPAIIMACVQAFGADFLEKLPFETIQPNVRV